MRVACVLLPDFEVAVELRRRPELAGASVVVGGLPHERKRVRSRSAEAAAAGVEVGMPLRQAQSLCPGARFLPLDEPFYRESFDRVMAALDAFSPRVSGSYPASSIITSPTSQGERKRHSALSPQSAALCVYLDVSGTELLFGPEEQLGRRMAGAVERVAGLRPRVGIAHGSFVARTAASMAEPGGAVAVERRRARAFLAPLPVEHLPCSPEMLRRLYLLGLRTIGRLAALPAGALAEQFGPEGELIARLARGDEEGPVVAREMAPLLEEEMEMDPPVSQRQQLEAAASRLVEKLAARLKSEYAACREVELWLDLSDGSAFHQATALYEPADQAGTLLRAVKRLIERIVTPGGRTPSVMLSAAKPCPERQRRDLPGPPETCHCDALETLRSAQGDSQRAPFPIVHLPDGEDIAISRIRIALAGLSGHHGEQLGLFRSQAADLKRARRTVWEVEERLGGGIIHSLAGTPEGRAAGRPLRVMADEAGRPRALLLDGRWERVREVSNRWRVREGWWRRELSREYYRVITERGRLCLIFKDLSPSQPDVGRSALPRQSAGTTWFLERIYA